MHIYLGQMYSPPIDHRCMESCFTKEVSHIAECTSAKAPLLQLMIDLWNTTTLHKCNRGISWPRGGLHKGHLDIVENASENALDTQIVKNFRKDVPPSRGIWWPRGLQCKVILTFWGMKVRMHWIHR